MRRAKISAEPFKVFDVKYELGAYLLDSKEWLNEVMEVLVEEVSEILYRELKDSSRSLDSQLLTSVEEKVADAIVKEALDEFRVKGSPVDLLIVRDARLNHPYQVRNGKDLLEVLEVSFRTQFVGLTKYRSKVITNLKTRYGLRLS